MIHRQSCLIGLLRRLPISTAAPPSFLRNDKIELTVLIRGDTLANLVLRAVTENSALTGIWRGHCAQLAPLLGPEVNATLGCGKHQYSLTRDGHEDAAGFAVYCHIAPIDRNGTKDLVRVRIDHAHASCRWPKVNAVFSGVVPNLIAAYPGDRR